MHVGGTTRPAEQPRVDARLHLAVLVARRDDRTGVDRLRGSELARRRARRVAPDVVAVPARQRVVGERNPRRVVRDAADAGTWCELHGDAPSREVLVAKRFDRHVLLLPATVAQLARRNEAGLAERHRRVAGLGRDLLEPDPVLDRVQHRHAPVVRLRPGLHAHDGRRLAAEGEAAVVRVPDVGDVDRLGGLGVQVPVLPVEEGALGECGRARRGERRQNDQRARRERGAEAAHRAVPEQDHRAEHRHQQHRPAQQVVAGQQRPRPADADDERHRSQARPAGGDRQRKGEREGEQREQQDAVHPRMRRRVERHLVVVELEEAVAEPGEHPRRAAPRRGRARRRSRPSASRPTTQAATCGDRGRTSAAAIASTTTRVAWPAS